MLSLSRPTLFSTTAIIFGGIVSLGSLTGKTIDAGGGALMGEARATVAPASSSSDFPICHTPAAAERTNIVLSAASAGLSAFNESLERNAHRATLAVGVESGL
jgi:hypothetical protein